MGTKVIKELRKGKGDNGKLLTKQKLGQMSGVGRGIISRMEKEEGHYTYQAVEKVLHALGYKIQFVLDDRGR